MVTISCALLPLVSALGKTSQWFKGEAGWALSVHCCLSSTDFQTAQRTRVRVEWKTGAAAHDWEQVAKRDNLNNLQTELLTLEQAIHDIHLELQRIRRKEEEMRNINGNWPLHVLLVCSLGLTYSRTHSDLFICMCRGNKRTCCVARDRCTSHVPWAMRLAVDVPPTILQAKKVAVNVVASCTECRSFLRIYSHLFCLQLLIIFVHSLQTKHTIVLPARAPPTTSWPKLPGWNVHY